MRPRSLTPLWISAALLVLGLGLWEAGFRWNHTASAPRGLYRLVSAEDLQPGDQIAVCLPLEVATFGRSRGYLTRGPCPGSTSSLLKTVGAVGGDRIDADLEGVWRDGRPLQRPGPKFDGSERPLELVVLHRRLSAEELWLSSHHERSWDSRYYGPATRRWILGRVVPLWTID